MQLVHTLINRILIQGTVCIVVFFVSLRVFAGDPKIEFFENKIRPVLIKHCYECHSAASSEIKGDLRVDSRKLIRAGGESGEAVVPFKPEESLLIEALNHESFEMPPDKKLSDKIINDFKKWIKMGAADPRDMALNPKEAAEVSRNAIFEERRKWWSLQPLNNHPPQELKNNHWSENPIDKFILAQMQKRNLQPAEDADPLILLRRLSFVLTGLPPASKMVREFPLHYANNQKTALNKLVDSFLNSPHYGERIARHWMDVVRYTDTYGYEWDNPAKGSWEYRDYLIRAFNEDIGFNQLVSEQIAGDLLEPPRINKNSGLNESLIGPMFYHLGEHRHGDSLEFNGIHQEMINNKIDAFSKAFLANSIACARCHDHKLDAVWQRDYYALAGVFMTPRWTSRVIDSPDKNIKTIQQLKKLRSEIHDILKDNWKRQSDSFERELAFALSAEKSTKDLQKILTNDPSIKERVILWKKAFKKESTIPKEKETESKEKKTNKPKLHEIIYPVTRLFIDPQNKSTADIWKEISSEWKSANETHKSLNSKKFQILTDFSNPDFPSGWAPEGDGLIHGYVTDGVPLIALEGKQTLQRVLNKGYHTNALSSKLPGAVRLPPEKEISDKSVSIQLAGGEWSGFLRIPDNAFQTENVIFLNQHIPSWRTFTDTVLKNGVQRKTIEIATSDLNPNFPPRTGKATIGKTILPENDFGFNKRSWFSLTGIVTHAENGIPVDELNHFESLYSQEIPQNKEEAIKNIAHWFTKSITDWAKGKADSEDVKIMNWLLSQHLLNNNSQPGSELNKLVSQYRMIENSLSFPRTVNSMDERNVIAINYPLNIRGNVDETGPEVARDFLQVFAGENNVNESTGSGRLEMANYLVSPKHPLTARVYVNRVWQWIFGNGIVRTPNDFGHLGIKPTHPELLDYLAKEFISDGWSTKRLIRRMVLSRTFRQAGDVTENKLKLDPDNRQLHHYSTRRLGAESIRDTLLAVSGRLDRQFYGKPIDPPRTKEDPAKRLFNGPLDGKGRRSIYIKMSIMDPPKFLTGFNLPDLKLPTGKRDVTNVPTQALILLNNPFVINMAEQWADRLIKIKHETIKDRIEQMFLESFSRYPSENEILRWTTLAKDFGNNKKENDLMNDRVTWQHVCHTMFNAKEFIYYR